MCVAMPGKVVFVSNEEKTAQVDFNGNLVTARTGLIPVSVGDQVLVHAGCILQKVSSTQAEELNELFKELGAYK